MLAWLLLPYPIHIPLHCVNQLFIAVTNTRDKTTYKHKKKLFQLTVLEDFKPWSVGPTAFGLGQVSTLWQELCSRVQSHSLYGWVKDRRGEGAGVL